MELQRGIPLLIQQFNALFTKNLLLSLRNKISIVLRIFSSLFFLLLLLWAQNGIDNIGDYSPLSHDVTDPKPLVSPPIPPCEDKFFIKPPCFDFVWSGNDSKRIQSIVSKIMANNPARPVPSTKVKSFRTVKEVDEWLLRDPMRCAGALHFTERDDTVISYGIETNSTDMKLRGQLEDQVFKFQIPLQIAAEREIARSLLGDPNFSWVVGLKEFARPALLSESLTRGNNAVYLFGPIFFLAIAMFSFVFQISSLVSEKELKLRQAMTMMGLYDTAYWFSWLIWEGVIIILSSLITVLFGMILKFDFFLRNSFAVVFLVFFLFQFSMMAFAFTLSTFIRKSSSSTTVGFSIFILSFMSSIVMEVGFPYSPLFAKKYRIMWSLFPPHPFIFALKMLASETAIPQEPGVSWSKQAECPAVNPNCVTMNDVFKWLASTFFLWFALAIYLDNIIPNTAGARKPIFYFLNPGYWTGNDGKKLKEGCCGEDSVQTLDHITPDDKDVQEEESVVKQQTREGEVDPNVAVQIRGLIKSYSGAISVGCHPCCCCCCCPKVKKTSSYQAVKGLWVNFAKDQLFCLLGPNGAGKTTAISCMTGITPVTRGDALIYGNSVRSSIGMSNIRRIIGVCPQFDILWDALSGVEHLRLFASIKGLPPSSIELEAQKLLTEVRIGNAANVRAGSYSGGMKRRLSVAIALIGDPKLVILDEPTTGMDPVTRRHVWDVIEDAKKGRAIVLTTHSMEEADILSDRIGIMAKGRLRCIGTSIRLKSRFGAGFLASVSFPESSNTITENQETVKMFFKHHLNVEAKEESKSLLKFVIPQHQEGLLTKFFGELQCREREFGIKDIQLSLTTLEEVFLNIAKKAELEMALAEGNMATLTLSSSGASLEVPIGARFVGIPGTESPENPKGVMVEVYWDQDDSGSLCISGHSPETPVPAHAQLKTLPTVAPPEGHVHGVLIDI